ncbi:hypothetical protein [Burkholderia glumae]|nr:hypothetical protein [Burkholderia glumae]
MRLNSRLQTFANQGLDAAADIRDMRSLLGHASPVTATHYAKGEY